MNLEASVQGAIAACEWGIAQYVFFSSNVFSGLIYYSHLTPVAVALIFGIYIYLSNRKSLLNRVFLFNALVLSLWMLLDLVLWATDSPRIVMMAWSLVNLIEPIIYAGFVYFALVFASGGDVSWRKKLWIVLPLLPTIVLAATSWNVVGFNLTNCDREVIEGPLVFYNYLIEVGYAAWIGVIGIRMVAFKDTVEKRLPSLMVVLFTLLLLLGFASGNIVGSFSEDWTIGQYGLFVIPVSLGALSYFVVQIRFAGRSQIMAAQVLVIGLLIAVGSVLFIQNISYIRWVILATLVFLAVLGLLLLKSFRNEIHQRHEIERLADQLQSANEQQATLIRFITHQLKGYMAKSRNIFSLIREGDLGPVPEVMRPMIEEGFRSGTKGALTIDDILNASNIKTGKISYVKQPFDIAGLVRTVVEGLRVSAESKGVALTLTAPESALLFTGDRAQLENALRNLVDNAIKYTPSGSVHVTLERDGTVLRFSTQDTGVGIAPEDRDILFTEGGHGKESRLVNVDSTGFGLYIVKNIIEAHQGTVRAESDGVGKGSRFIAELPCA